MSFENIEKEIKRYNGIIEPCSEDRYLLSGNTHINNFNDRVLGYTEESGLETEIIGKTVFWELCLPEQRLYDIEKRIKKSIKEKSVKRSKNTTDRRKKQRINSKLKYIKDKYNHGTY